MFQVTSTTSAIHGLTFHKHMLRQDELIDSRNGDKAAQDRADAAAFARRKAASRRTAWIIAAIAAAFFIASLVQGHFAHIPH